MLLKVLVVVLELWIWFSTAPAVDVNGSHRGLHLQFISFFKEVVKAETKKSTKAGYRRKEGRKTTVAKRMQCAYEYEPSTFL